MAFFTKSRIGTLVVLLAASSPPLAQSRAPHIHPNDASVPDARQIIILSIVATERSWQAGNDYIYTERVEDRRLDSLAQMKSEDVDVTRMILVNGARF